MVRLVIANTFSVNMLPQKSETTVNFERIDLVKARKLIKIARSRNVEIYSIVGHQSTAQLLSQLLGIEIPANRINYTIDIDDIMLIFTVPFRLPEGKVLSEEELKQIADKINIFIAYVAEAGGGPNVLIPGVVPASPQVGEILSIWRRT